jgi:peptidoglycan/LPS O-acetylase OafA/YrhL
LAIMMGKMGRFLVYGGNPRRANDFEKDDSTPGEAPKDSRRFQFSLARLLAATTVVAIVFGLSRMYFVAADAIHYSFSGLVGAALGVLVLFVKKSDLPRIAMSVLLGGFGALVGLILGAPGGLRPRPPLQELYYVIPGILLGWFIGCLLSRWDERIGKKK